MSTMIQIRHVPEQIHREVKARAALAGMSMSEFILQELKRVIERPSRQDLLRRLEKLPGVELYPSPSAMVRAERDSR